jgi:hypothetical protein
MMKLHAQFEDEEHAMNRRETMRLANARAGPEHGHGHGHGHSNAGAAEAQRRHSFDRNIHGPDKHTNPIFANPVVVAAQDPGHDLKHFKFSQSPQF